MVRKYFVVSGRSRRALHDSLRHPTPSVLSVFGTGYLKGQRFPFICSTLRTGPRLSDPFTMDVSTFQSRSLGVDSIPPLLFVPGVQNMYYNPFGRGIYFLCYHMDEFDVCPPEVHLTHGFTNSFRCTIVPLCTSYQRNPKLPSPVNNSFNLSSLSNGFNGGRERSTRLWGWRSKEICCQSRYQKKTCFCEVELT